MCASHMPKKGLLLSRFVMSFFRWSWWCENVTALPVVRWLTENIPSPVVRNMFSSVRAGPHVVSVVRGVAFALWFPMSHEPRLVMLL